MDNKSTRNKPLVRPTPLVNTSTSSQQTSSQQQLSFPVMRSKSNDTITNNGTSSVTKSERLAVLALQVGKTNELYKAEIERLDVTKKRVRQTFMFFGVISTLVGCLVAWIFIQQYRFKQQFGAIIDIIDKARSTGIYTGPSGLETIWAYEYGQIGAFLSGFTSSDLAVAIVDSFYDSDMHMVFLGDDAGVTTLTEMLELSKRGDYNANQIMCTALYPTQNGEPGKCMSNCNVSGVTTSAGITAKYLGAATAGMGAGAGAGIVVSQAATAIFSTVPGIGPILGLAVGLGSIGLSVGMAHSDVQKSKSACQASLKNCINVSGVSC